MNLSASNFIENRHLVHRWLGVVLIIVGFAVTGNGTIYAPVWKAILALILVGFGTVNVMISVLEKEKTNPTEQHRERVLNALDGLQDAKEALDAVNYDHPNVIRARLHVAKAMECLERRQQRLQREARPKKAQAASVNGGNQ